MPHPHAAGGAGGGTGIAFPWIMFSFRPPSSPGADRHARTVPLTSRMAIAIALLATQACGGAGTAGGEIPREVWGFTAFWDSASARSVARHGSSLDAVVTTWIALDTAGGLPSVLFLDTARAARIPDHRLALVTSYLHPAFRPESIRRLAANPRMLARVAASIAGTLTTAHHRGAVLDFEALTAGDLPALLAVIRAIADTLHAHRLGPVVVAVPAVDTTAYPGRPIIEAGADLILPMLYDQHWAGGAPGPIAEPRWVESAVQARVREVGADRIVAGLPLYGYRWTEPGRGVTVNFAEAGRWNDAAVPLVRDSSSGFLRARLPDGGEVWVTDARLLGELVATVERNGVQRFALWYVGQEDPDVWRDLLPGVLPDSPDR